MFGAGVVGPLAGADALPSALGGDDEAGGVGKECFGDELFAHVGAVGVGGVDEVDVELDGAAEGGERAGLVLGFAPDACAGDAHGAVAEAIHDEGLIAARGTDGECSCCRCGRCHGCYCLLILVRRSSHWMIVLRKFVARSARSYTSSPWTR